MGAVLLELKDSFREPPASWGPILVGAVVSFVVGSLALRGLLWVIRGGRLHSFAYYVFPLGVLLGIYGALYGK